MEPTNLYLVDATALAYRSHFAFARSPLTGPDGRPTGAAFGYTQALTRLLQTARPDRVAAAFDGPERTFRHELLPAYKATREKTPDELLDQLPEILGVTRALGVAVLERPGVEADDLIATLARRGAEAGLQVYIVSGDKDFAQLVSERIRIYNIFGRDEAVEILDPAGVEAKWGVPPARFCDFLALTGDASDNVPGIPGVGPKTAVELLQEYGDLEGVLTRGTGYKRPRVAEAIRAHAGAARLARRLVTLEIGLELPLGPDDLAPRPPDREELRRIYGKMGFTSLLAALPAGEAPRGDHDYRTVADGESLAALLRELAGSRGFAVDTETTGLDPLRADLVGLSFSTRPGLAFYVALNGGGEAWRTEALAALKPLLEEPGRPKWGQNLKFDLLALHRAGIELAGAVFDTMVASYCVVPEERSHGLDALCLKYLDYRKIPTTDVIGKGRDQVTMDQVAVPVVAEYACEDADYTGRLKTILEAELEREGLETLFRELEMPLVPVLTRMEREGIRVDPERLGALSVELGERLGRLEDEVCRLAGRPFNLRSNQQVGTILFEELKVHEAAGMKRPRRTKTGSWSTDAAVLELLAPHHEVPRLLLLHRELSKLKGTYVDALPGLIHPDTGRIHTSFHQTVTFTGRLSSSDPNLQNIPVRTEEGRRVRACFVPRAPGWRFLSLDYSQIELRVMAHFSGDEGLIAAFRNGEDIHRRTAALILGKEQAEVSAEERARAKVVNFGILYGMGPRRLAQETGLTFQEATGFIERYFAALPGVRAWLDETLAGARRDGQVTTLFGRRRRLPEIQSHQERVRAGAENVAVNTPIQGSAADIVKRAMIEVDRFLREQGLETRLVLQVHDELLFDGPAGEVARIAGEIRRLMEGVVVLEVPLKVEIGSGDDWLAAHP